MHIHDMHTIKYMFMLHAQHKCVCVHLGEDESLRIATHIINIIIVVCACLWTMQLAVFGCDFTTRERTPDQDQRHATTHTTTHTSTTTRNTLAQIITESLPHVCVCVSVLVFVCACAVGPLSTYWAALAEPTTPVFSPPMRRMHTHCVCYSHCGPN